MAIHANYEKPEKHAHAGWPRPPMDIEAEGFYRPDDGPPTRAVLRGQFQHLRAIEGGASAFAASAAEMSANLTSMNLNAASVSQLVRAQRLAIRSATLQVRGACPPVTPSASASTRKPLTPL